MSITRFEVKKAGVSLAFAGILAVLILFFALFPIHGEEEQARDLTSSVRISGLNFSQKERLTDGKAEWGSVCTEEGGKLNITASEEIGGLYIRFNELSGEFTAKIAGKSLTCGKDRFLHEWIDVEGAFGDTTAISLCFHGRADIAEITVFSKGARPDGVQIWKPTLNKADLLLFSAHSDDDQLFFAGVIPKYCAAGYDVQVAFLTMHPENPCRRHELLDGLWAAGCKNYPVMGDFADFRIDHLQDTLAEYEARGVSLEALQGFIVETTRKTRPLVVVSHDPEGEYGHGMHRLLSKLIRDQIPLTGDPESFPQSAHDHGTWQVQKTYLHLYGKNKIVLDIDTPLPYFNGKTAFQVSQQSFLNCHPSQHGGWYFTWQQGTAQKPVTSSKQLKDYNPAHYGLYDSAVGADKGQNDFFENLLSHRQQEEKLKMDEAAILKEKEALAQKNAEELKKTKSELALKTEEAAELERRLALQKEERERLEEEREALSDLAEEQRRRGAIGTGLAVLFATLATLFGGILLGKRGKK